MTAGTPHDGGDDAADGDDESAQAHDEDPSAASADAGTAAPTNGDPDRGPTPKSESQSDTNAESERDDLTAELARKRPPQPPQEELDELQQPATELRPATVQESGANSTAEPADPAPTTAQADRTRADDEQEPGVAGLDECQPVATELRPATAQAADAQSTGSAISDTAGTARDRERDSEAEPEDEEDEV